MGQKRNDSVSIGFQQYGWEGRIQLTNFYGMDLPVPSQKSLEYLRNSWEAQRPLKMFRMVIEDMLPQCAFRIKEKALGADHPDVAQSLNNLARLHDNQGKYAEAEPLFRRALSILKQALGLEHPNTQFVRRNNADLLKKMKSEKD